MYNEKRCGIKMKKTTKKITGVLVLMVCVAAIVIAGFYFISKQDKEKAEDPLQPTTEVEKLLKKDLESNYPETPAEVVKMYWRFNKCMYNTSLEDKDFEGLLKQLRLMYDEEFLAAEDNSWDNMLKNFKKDKEVYESDKKTISNYNVEPNSEVKYGEVDGKECATVVSATLIKKKSEREMVYEKFMCRKDSKGDWKRLGWSITKDKDDIAAVTAN